MPNESHPTASTPPSPNNPASSPSSTINGNSDQTSNTNQPSSIKRFLRDQLYDFSDAVIAVLRQFILFTLTGAFCGAFVALLAHRTVNGTIIGAIVGAVLGIIAWFIYNQGLPTPPSPRNP